MECGRRRLSTLHRLRWAIVRPQRLVRRCEVVSQSHPAVALSAELFECHLHRIRRRQRVLGVRFRSKAQPPIVWSTPVKRDASTVAGALHRARRKHANERLRRASQLRGWWWRMQGTLPAASLIARGGYSLRGGCAHYPRQHRHSFMTNHVLHQRHTTPHHAMLLHSSTVQACTDSAAAGRDLL